MYASGLIIGILILIAGLLVKPFPNLIAGYNMLTKRDKEKIDIKRYSAFMGNTLVGLGIVVILIGIFMKWFEVKEHYSVLISTTLIVITVLYITFQGGAFLKREVIKIQMFYHLQPIQLLKDFFSFSFKII